MAEKIEQAKKFLSEQNEKKFGLKEIAQILGVSKATISLAMSGSPKISAETRQRVEKAIRKFGYKKNALLSSVMSNIKSSGPKAFLETIVLVNANVERQVRNKYPIFARYMDGIKASAAELGYGIYEVWLHDKNLDAQKLENILRSRNIRGGVIIGHLDNRALPAKFASIWKNFKFVSAGLKTSKPNLDCVSADKFLIAHQATLSLIKKGFKRPALVIDSRIDELVEGRFIGGFLRAQFDLDEPDRIPPFVDIKKAEHSPKVFFDWLEKYKPDVVFSISKGVADWLDTPKISNRIKKNSQLVNLEGEADGEWSGIDKNYEYVGRLAVRKLFAIMNAPTTIDVGISTATVVQPKWED